MRYLILLAALLSLGFAETTYIWEDFDDGDADGWTEWPDYGAATYEVTDSFTYHMYYAGSDSEWALAYWDSEMPSADYTMLMDFVAHGATTHVGLCGRFDIQNVTGYIAYAHYGIDRLVVGKYIPGWVTLKTYNFDFSHEQQYQMKFQIEASTLRAKVWEMGSTEPDWQIDVTDSDLTAPGYVELECGSNPSGPFSAEFDNILVSDTIPFALNQTTWGGIKATF